jgi:hypothetical protein
MNYYIVLLLIVSRGAAASIPQICALDSQCGPKGICRQNRCCDGEKVGGGEGCDICTWDQCLKCKEGWEWRLEGSGCVPSLSPSLIEEDCRRRGPAWWWRRGEGCIEKPTLGEECVVKSGWVCQEPYYCLLLGGVCAPRGCLEFKKGKCTKCHPGLWGGLCEMGRREGQPEGAPCLLKGGGEECKKKVCKKGRCCQTPQCDQCTPWGTCEKCKQGFLLKENGLCVPPPLEGGGGEFYCKCHQERRGRGKKCCWMCETPCKNNLKCQKMNPYHGRCI